MWEVWQNDLILHWRRGGGPLAAALWWSVFVILTAGISVLSIQDELRSRESRRAVSSLASLKQITLAALMYARDYDDRLPDMSSLSPFRRAVAPYLNSAHGASIPSQWRTPDVSGGAYVLNASLSHRKTVSLPRHDRVPVIWDPKRWRGRYQTVAFLDGHVRSINVEQWKRLREESAIPADTVGTDISPPWWERYPWSSLGNGCLFLAVGAAALASWLEATDRASGRRFYLFILPGWFLLRFLLYGMFLCLLSSFVGSLIAALFIHSR